MLNQAYMLTTVGDDHVLLPCDDSGGVDLTEIIVLNETAYDMVSFIEKKSSNLTEIIDYMSGLYDISREQLSFDIEYFISDLDKHRALIRK